MLRSSASFHRSFSLSWKFNFHPVLLCLPLSADGCLGATERWGGGREAPQSSCLALGEGRPEERRRVAAGCCRYDVRVCTFLLVELCFTYHFGSSAEGIAWAGYSKSSLTGMPLSDSSIMILCGGLFFSVGNRKHRNTR